MKLALRLILLFSLAFYSSACQPEERKQINFPVYSPTPPKVKKLAYAKPEVGMEYKDFKDLCITPDKESSDDDDVSQYQSSDNVIVTHKLGYTKIRNMRGCWGNFMFVNGKLDSIFRN